MPSRTPGYLHVPKAGPATPLPAKPWRLRGPGQSANQVTSAPLPSLASRSPRVPRTPAAETLSSYRGGFGLRG